MANLAPSIAFLKLIPDMAETFDGVEGIKLELERDKRTLRQHNIAWNAEIAGKRATVQLVRDTMVEDSGAATFSGEAEIDVAFALTAILAMLPLELVTAMVGHLTNPGGRLGALRLLSQVAPGVRGSLEQDAIARAIAGAVQDADPGVNAFGSVLRDSMPELPQVGGRPALVALPLIPLEPLATTLNRFPDDFPRRPANAGVTDSAVDAWDLDDAAGNDAHVRLLVDQRWNIGCAVFSGSASVDFAVRLARSFRYLPLELARAAALGCSDPPSRARSIAALGMHSLVPAAWPGGVHPEVMSVFAAAQQDPAIEVRALATMFSMRHGAGGDT